MVNIKMFKCLRVRTHAVPREGGTSGSKWHYRLGQTAGMTAEKLTHARQTHRLACRHANPWRSLRWFAILLSPAPLEFGRIHSCVCIPVVSELLFPPLFLILCPFCIHAFYQLTRDRACLVALTRLGSATGFALENVSRWKLLIVMLLPFGLRKYGMFSLCSSGLSNLLVQGQWMINGASPDPAWSVESAQLSSQSRSGNSRYPHICVGE